MIVEELKIAFEQELREEEVPRRSQERRRRAKGAGRKPRLETKMALPKRKLTTMSEFKESFPEVNRVILDGTERPIQRSKDQEKQKQDYSGKKKRHTRNHLGAVDPDKRILILSKRKKTES